MQKPEAKPYNRKTFVCHRKAAGWSESRTQWLLSNRKRCLRSNIENGLCAYVKRVLRFYVKVIWTGGIIGVCNKPET